MLDICRGAGDEGQSHGNRGGLCAGRCLNGGSCCDRGAGHACPARPSRDRAYRDPVCPFVTLLFSRTEISAADGCVLDNSRIARLVPTVALYLQSLGLKATGTLVTGKSRTLRHYALTRVTPWGASGPARPSLPW